MVVKKVFYTQKTWYTGIFFKTKHREYYYLKNSYMRCLTYYCNWSYNQGGKLTISENKSVSRSVVEGVERELGIEGAVAYKVNRNYEDTVTIRCVCGTRI